IDTLVIERAAFGGQAAATERLDNMPGFADGIEGARFAGELRRQTARFGVEMLQAQDVTGFHTREHYHVVTTADGSTYSGRALLLAPGSRYRRLGVPGENDFIGAGVHFCATCDGPYYRGQEVLVIGGGNSAAEESLFLAAMAKHVTLLVRSDRLTASQVAQDNLLAAPNVTVRYHTAVEKFEGARGKLQTVTVRDAGSGDVEQLHPAGVFVFIGLTPNTSFIAPGQMQLDKWGFIVTGHALVHHGNRPPGFEVRDPGILETSVPGVFAAGDVRDASTKQVAAATGEGATAALLIREYLKLV
ncbi:MAG: NAD(P)/FAD-dependent oxidoreductase, partial [Caldilineaceae bacterium]